MHHLRRIAAAPLILCLLFTASCSDQDLRKVEQALVDVALGAVALKDMALEARSQGLIDQDTANEIAAIGHRIVAADREAVALARSISKLDTASKGKILAILQPILVSVQSMTNSGLIGIKNLETRAKVRGVLVAIQTGLVAVQVVVTVTGGK